MPLRSNAGAGSGSGTPRGGAYPGIPGAVGGPDGSIRAINALYSCGEDPIVLAIMLLRDAVSVTPAISACKAISGMTFVVRKSYNSGLVFALMIPVSRRCEVIWAVRFFAKSVACVDR